VTRRASGVVSLGLIFMLVLGLAVSSCTETVRVLSGPDASSADAAIDAGMPDAGPGPEVCLTCRAFELCAVNRCVDPAGLTQLSAGLRHNCIVRDGAIECWGDNARRQLASTDRTDRLSPVRVDASEEWLMVAAGDEHTCAIRATGALHCAGDNTVGQLGLGDRLPRDRFSPLPAPEDFTRISCGGDNCCATRLSGELYCFGDNLFGTPGLGDAEGSSDVDLPTRVMSDDRFTAVSVGTAHACAIRRDGALFCWGRNVDGELGVGREATQQRQPMRVGRESDWTNVAAGEHHTCGIRGPGALYCWGSTEFGELGLGTDMLDDETLFAEPVHVGVDDDWASVATGWFHTCALKHSGALFCFGRAAEGQLGIGTYDRESSPKAVAPERRFRTLALGRFHSCAVDAERKLFCFGANTDGQLGLGDRMTRDAPTEVP
jgi:alpha-tubulin suppressor-like RCC1 family protein